MVYANLFLVRDVNKHEKLALIVTTISESPFCQVDLELGESENDNILVGLIYVSPHFGKSTLGVGESEYDIDGRPPDGQVPY